MKSMPLAICTIFFLGLLSACSPGPEEASTQAAPTAATVNGQQDITPTNPETGQPKDFTGGGGAAAASMIAPGTSIAP